MDDCMYVMTQGELDELESRLEWYKTGEALKAAAEKAIAVLSETFALVTSSIEEVIKSFSAWYLGIIGTDSETYKYRPRPKRPQRKILLRSRIIDHRACIYNLLPKRRSV